MDTELESRRPRKTKSFLSLFKSYSAKSNDPPSSLLLPLLPVVELRAPPIYSSQNQNKSPHIPTNTSLSAPTCSDTTSGEVSTASTGEISGRKRKPTITWAVNNEPPVPSPLELPRLSSDIASDRREVMVEQFPEAEVKVPSKLWNGGRLDDFLEEIAPLSDFQLPGRDRTSTFFDQDTLWDAIGLKEGSGSTNPIIYPQYQPSYSPLSATFLITPLPSAGLRVPPPALDPPPVHLKTASIQEHHSRLKHFPIPPSGFASSYEAESDASLPTFSPVESIPPSPSSTFPRPGSISSLASGSELHSEDEDSFSLQEREEREMQQLAESVLADSGYSRSISMARDGSALGLSDSRGSSIFSMVSSLESFGRLSHGAYASKDFVHEDFAHGLNKSGDLPATPTTPTSFRPQPPLPRPGRVSPPNSPQSDASAPSLILSSTESDLVSPSLPSLDDSHLPYPRFGILHDGNQVDPREDSLLSTFTFPDSSTATKSQQSLLPPFPHDGLPPSRSSLIKALSRPQEPISRPDITVFALSHDTPLPSAVQLKTPTSSVSSLVEFVPLPMGSPSRTRTTPPKGRYSPDEDTFAPWGAPQGLEPLDSWEELFTPSAPSHDDLTSNLDSEDHMPALPQADSESSEDDTPLGSRPGAVEIQQELKKATAAQHSRSRANSENNNASRDSLPLSRPSSITRISRRKDSLSEASALASSGNPAPLTALGEFVVDNSPRFAMGTTLLDHSRARSQPYQTYSKSALPSETVTLPRTNHLPSMATSSSDTVDERKISLHSSRPPPTVDEKISIAPSNNLKSHSPAHRTKSLSKASPMSFAPHAIPANSSEATLPPSAITKPVARKLSTRTTEASAGSRSEQMSRATSSTSAVASTSTSRRPSVQSDHAQPPQEETRRTAPSSSRNSFEEKPSISLSTRSNVHTLAIAEHRIFVVDHTNHFIVKVSATTRCGEILLGARSRGLLSSGTEAEGGFALWEICRGLGVERAIREFEALSDVINSWNSETNILIIRRTTLAPILSVYSRATVSPIAKSAFVHVELKRGKWAKRYLEIKNGAVLHSKSENGKDSTLVCQLSAFDAFFVAKHTFEAIKPPKPFVFALKSLLPRAHYEDNADYCYFFCVKTQEEMFSWIRALTEARNVYVRQREQNLITARADASEKAAQTTPHIPPTKLLDAPKGPALTSTALASTAVSRQMPPQLDFRTSSLAVTPAPLAASKIGTEETSLALSKPPAQVWSDMNEKERQIWRQKKEREARTGGNAFLNFGGAATGQRERKK